MASHTTMNKKSHKHDRSRLAFTLVEMLTVITIMSIIAAMVVTMAQNASQKKKIVAVNGEKEKLITMIENYHNKLNFYPPDNPLLSLNVSNANYDGLAATNPLIYELTGATNFGGTNLAVFNTNSLSTTAYNAVFNREGVANGDALEPHNFFQPPPTPKEYAALATNQGARLYGLIVPVELVPGNTNNFWHYDSSTTRRHNMTSYDLWGEFYIANIHGHMTIITNGNW
jgi:prepilin-type N-terminal cleavage/methylation domain-containing protein